MKPGNGLTTVLLARHNVSSLEEITRDMVSTADLQIINGHMSVDAREVIADASGVADEAREPVVIKRNHRKFQEAGFHHSTEEELMAIGRIYGAHGREIDITQEGIVVHPRTALQRKKIHAMA